jgi:hypothetical protein
MDPSVPASIFLTCGVLACAWAVTAIHADRRLSGAQQRRHVRLMIVAMGVCAGGPIIAMMMF